MITDWATALDHVYGSFDPYDVKIKDLELPMAKALWNLNPWVHWKDEVVNDYKEELYVVKQLQRACVDCARSMNKLMPREMRSYIGGLVMYSTLPEHVVKLIEAWMYMDDGLSLTKRITRVLGFVCSYISSPCAFDHLK